MFLSIFSDETALDFTEALPYIKSWGLKYLDLRARIFRKSVDALSPEELATVRKMLADNGLKLACLQSSLGKVHLPGPERLASEMRKLDGLIRAADALDCHLVRSFYFWQPPNGQETKDVGELAARPDVLAQVLDMFAPFAEKAQKAGLTLAFENCGCTKEECFAMLDALNIPGWGFAWDPKNSWMRDKEERDHDLDAYINLMAKRANCIHVKSIGAIDFPDNFDPIPYSRILNTLDLLGFNGPVSIETHNFVKERSNLEACEKTLAVVRKAWPTAAAGSQQESCSISASTVSRPYEDNPVRFAVVGLGMGHNRASEMAKTPGIKLTQVCDLRLDRCQRTSEALHVPYTQNFDELLANPDIEAVMVLNETGRHHELALRALNAGKNVLVTKPMDMTLAACDQMIDTARNRGLLLAQDHCRRLRPSVQSLKAAHEAGFFGQPLAATVTLKIKRTMDYFHENGGWRGTPDLDGGVLSNQTIHHLDELLFVFGKPAAVRCDAWTQTHDIQMEDLGLATWRYADGMIVSILATTSYPQSSWYYQMEIHGTKGAYIHREGGAEKSPTTLYFHHNAWTPEAPFPRECPWLNSMDNFASVLRCGGPLLTTPQEGRNAVELIQAMYESAYRNGGNWVSL